jgi:hypothetical protein
MPMGQSRPAATTDSTNKTPIISCQEDQKRVRYKVGMMVTTSTEPPAATAHQKPVHPSLRLFIQHDAYLSTSARCLRSALNYRSGDGGVTNDDQLGVGNLGQVANLAFEPKNISAKIHRALC